MSEQAVDGPRTTRAGSLLGYLPRGQSLPENEWRVRHRAIVVLLWAHAVAVPVFGVVRHLSPLHTFAESLIVPAAALAAAAPALTRRMRTVAASMGLLSASAVLVHMSGGVIEMHFHFFVMVTVVALYQDWLPFLAAIAYVFVHHGVFGAIDPGSVFNHRAALERPWVWAGIHALFIAGTSATCLVTWRLNEKTLGLRDKAEARQAAIAVDNARLYEAEHQARVASEVAQARLGLVVEASRVLTSSLELDEILGDLATLVARNVADCCVIDVVDVTGALRRVASAGTLGGFDVKTIFGGCDVPADEQHPARQALRTRRAELLIPAPADLFGPGVAWPEAARPSAAIVAPMVGRHDALAVLTIARSSDVSPLTNDDLVIAEELARRAGVAVENAQLYARQRSVSETLQHSLLPERLPEVPGIESAARYRAGGPGVEVGGDWYDLLSLGTGRVMLAMGDVVGRGERAAALMGQLRTAARVYAIEGHQPAEIIGRLNDLLHDLGPGEMATMACAELDPEVAQITIASAGHPPPITISPSGDARLVDAPNGPPLGAVARASYGQTTLSFEAGSTLALYTDGLVEDRSTPLDVGLERLRAALVGSHPDLEALCDRALATLPDGCEDDVALLAVRMLVLGDRVELRLPTRPGILQPLRTTMRRWLVGAGVPDGDVYEVLVATGEACANAIRHTRWSGSGFFEVDARIADNIVITVRDGGTWRASRGDDGGGRGLPLIEAFMDHVDIATSPAGTTVTMTRRVRRLAAHGVES